MINHTVETIVASKKILLLSGYWNSPTRSASKITKKILSRIIVFKIPNFHFQLM